MNNETTGNRTKSILIIMALLLLIMFLLIGMRSCGRSSEPSGKYYSEELDGIYYEFDGKSTCYLYVENGSKRVRYKYVVNKEDVDEVMDKDGDIHKTYVVHITDVNSSGSHRLVFDSHDNAVFDPDFGLFIK